MDVNIGVDRLMEPFDFTTAQTDTRLKKWRVVDATWEEMMEEAEKCKVPTLDVDRRPRSKPTRAQGRGRGRGWDV